MKALYILLILLNIAFAVPLNMSTAPTNLKNIT